MPQQFTSAACPTCQTTFEHVPVDSDASGSYAALEARPCADANCGALLCPACASFSCDGCGETFCQSHAVAIPDGTDRPLQCCAACAEDVEVEHCPMCDSTSVRTDYIEFGVEAITGYHDTAAIFTCSACGVRGESEELVKRPALPARREPGRETREAARARRA